MEWTPQNTEFKDTALHQIHTYEIISNSFPFSQSLLDILWFIFNVSDPIHQGSPPHEPLKTMCGFWRSFHPTASLDGMPISVITFLYSFEKEGDMWQLLSGRVGPECLRQCGPNTDPSTGCSITIWGTYQTPKFLGLTPDQLSQKLWGWDLGTLHFISTPSDADEKLGSKPLLKGRS